MFCTKCGKEINDNSTFCNFCGAPVSNAAKAVPQPAPEQSSAPQSSAPQNSVPQNSAPQYGMPQNGQYPAQPSAPINVSFSLDAKMIGIIRKAVCGVLALLSLLIIIGAIGSMAVAGTLSSSKSSYSALISAASNMQGLYYLARVPAIIAFIVSVLGLGFSIFTKQRSLFAYVCACAGVLLFIFNFVLYGGYVSFAKSSLLSGSPKIGGIIVSGIFLIISSLIMIASSAAIVLNKEDIVNYRPKF